LLITGEPPKQAEDRKKPNPSACTGLAEHLLPRRHGLIQSFPKCNKNTLREACPCTFGKKSCPSTDQKEGEQPRDVNHNGSVSERQHKRGRPEAAVECHEHGCDRHGSKRRNPDMFLE